ncbi:MAG TPA: HNH endonuclease, partial [Xanthomonadales bacterium]|nr:HNH endonuclease [Xanthomonadales bacterium]
TCDSAVVQWLDQHDGQPLSAGRKSRTIPPAIRRALQRRDGGCRFPGCTATRFVDAHHIHHWADGGETCMENLVLLCTRHHHLVHEGGFGLEKDCGEFRFVNPQGFLIESSASGRSRGNVDSIFALNDKHGICITPKSSQSHWMGEKMDDQLAVEGLLFRE